jgi:hypothetical protein
MDHSRDAYTDIQYINEDVSALASIKQIADNIKLLADNNGSSIGYFREYPVEARERFLIAVNLLHQVGKLVRDIDRYIDKNTSTVKFYENFDKNFNEISQKHKELV